MRIWVETLVLTENTSQPSPGAVAHCVKASPAQPSPARSPTKHAGSPGAAPSSPRGVRAGAAAAAALGGMAPAITSYFCMALLIAPPLAEQQPAAEGRGPVDGGGQLNRRHHAALWAQHVAPLLLHERQPAAPPVLWLLTATSAGTSSTGDGCRVQLHLHAVRGLSAVVMSAGYGGLVSSTSCSSSRTRPAAVLWGQCAWEMPAGGGQGAAALLHRMGCWVSDEDGFPQLHAFAFGGDAQRLLLAGRSFATVEGDSSASAQVSLAWTAARLWDPCLDGPSTALDRRCVGQGDSMCLLLHAAPQAAGNGRHVACCSCGPRAGHNCPSCKPRQARRRQRADCHL